MEETHLRATERHLPYGITQCYLPLDTGERAPLYSLVLKKKIRKFLVFFLGGGECSCYEETDFA